MSFIREHCGPRVIRELLIGRLIVRHQRPRDTALRMSTKGALGLVESLNLLVFCTEQSYLPNYVDRVKNDLCCGQNEKPAAFRSQCVDHLSAVSTCSSHQEHKLQDRSEIDK